MRTARRVAAFYNFLTRTAQHAARDKNRCDYVVHRLKGDIVNAIVREENQMLECEAREPLLDNSAPTAVRYIAHVAVPCRDLDEAARWYADVLGAQPVRRLHDRVTFSFGGVLQFVCHLEPSDVVAKPRPYPRHHGLMFLRMEDFRRMKEHIRALGIKFVVSPGLRFAGRTDEHETFMVADPSGNVVEFKCYVHPECGY
jgi:extradiol dioxygenase family protein